MHSLFRRTFVAFTLSYAVLLVVLAGALVGGYRHSIATWSERRIVMVKDAASRVLAGQSPADAGLPQDVPVFIYDRDGALVASNRGGGWRRDSIQWERFDVRSGGKVVGHFEVGPTAFRDDAANVALAQSLTRTAGAGAVVALAVAMLTASLFARSLSRPAARVAAGIDSIAHDRQTQPIPEEGAEEISRIARAANTLAARLQHERELRTQWARDVTHDLRTPVASVRAQLEAIADGVYAGEPRRINGILSELARVETLISDLDELMRLEEPAARIKTMSFSTADLVSTLRQRFEHELRRSGVQLRVDIEAATIHADEALLDRAVSNIVGNAIRHSPAGGCVRLSVRNVDAENSRWTELLVRNDGPPIPSSELLRLFDRLYRGEYARNTPGTGLGLTIARRIVLLHGGTIDISSGASEGTAVRIAIPRNSR